MSALFGAIDQISQQVGDTFKNVSPILSATGAIQQSNLTPQQNTANQTTPTTQTSLIPGLSNTNLYLIIGGGVLLLVVLVILKVKK